MSLSRTQIVNWLTRCGDIFSTESEYLTGLDREIGDADHGLNMNRGFSKVVEKLPAIADKDIGFILKNTGMTLLSSVGGASGPLFGTFFIRAAQATQARQSLTLEELYQMFRDGADGVISRGKAEPGDKTMCDVWVPVVESLRQSSEQNLSVPVALEAASSIAESAAQSTITMQARKGRASYLGERSIGHQDRSLTGFSKTSSTPRRNALAISAIFSVADITRTGVWSPLLRICSSSLSPFIRGIAISHIIRSGVKPPSNSRASTPSAASTVVAPNEENHESRSERNTCSSSTMRICFPTNGCVMFSPLTGFTQ